MKAKKKQKKYKKKNKGKMREKCSRIVDQSSSSIYSWQEKAHIFYLLLFLKSERGSSRCRVIIDQEHDDERQET